MLVLDINSEKTGVSTIFVKLKDLYPECEILIEQSPQLFPLRCFVDHCPKNANCMEHLVRRTKAVFDAFESAQLLLLYYAYRDRPNSIRAGLFWRDVKEPRVITFNRSAWEKFKKKGIVYEWTMPEELWMPATPPGLLHNA